MSNVTITPAKKNNSTEQSTGCLTKVAAYCRVSTAEENQQNSYATQIAYYTEYITSNPDWQLVGIFAEKEKSAISSDRCLAIVWVMTDSPILWRKRQKL